MRLTPVRKDILNILTESKIPVRVSDLLTLLRNNHRNINKTTIYRDIEIFKSEGYITETYFKDMVVRYEIFNNKCHHHLVCDSCGNVINFDFNEDKFLKEAVGTTGFTITNHNIELFGICKSCYKS